MPIRLEIVSDESDEPVVVALIHLPVGILEVMAEVIWEEERLRLDGLHCHGVG
ncbi:hypothetical protein [Methylobacterium marchantiae]|uniref:Uncharacterized protein n=1 Tax=Methylobacterium marchantiae TaxID=600331 RepID=A0ABW3WWH1_9HYPH|nr:hypothetical protein AIGOOFII_3295 [Methylobacterium marchantiae]